MNIIFNQRKLALIFSCCVATASIAQHARADVTFTVDSTHDLADDKPGDGVCHTTEGTCTLRAAVMEGNRSSAFITNILLSANTYKLTLPYIYYDYDFTGALLISPKVSGIRSVISLQGVGAGNTIIDGNQIDSVIRISDGNASINGLTIRNGYYYPNSTDYTGGGGVNISTTSNVSIDLCVISGNTSVSFGGGIYVDIGSQLTLNRSTVSGNNTRSGGGGVENYLGNVTIVQSAIINNHAAIDGGGIETRFGQSFAVNTTITGNSANGNGGGIANQNGGATWLYSTSIIANDASHDRNPPGGSGGGVYNKPGNRLVATNSLIAANTTLDSPIADDCNGALEVYGWNLLADYGGCSFSGNGIAALGQVSTNTIGALASNGGPTMTHALLAGSEAIDTTTAQGCVGPTLALLATDQRGAPRITGAKCDVGAYEYGSVVPATDVIFSNGFD